MDTHSSGARHAQLVARHCATIGTPRRIGELLRLHEAPRDVGALDGEHRSRACYRVAGDGDTEV
jgi:hypothetical protein